MNTNTQTLYLICVFLVCLIILSLLLGCRSPDNESFKNDSKSKKKLSSEESTLLEKLKANATDDEILDFMNQHKDTFQSKESFNNIMDHLADEEKSTSKKKK